MAAPQSARDRNTVSVKIAEYWAGLLARIVIAETRMLNPEPSRTSRARWLHGGDSW